MGNNNIEEFWNWFQENSEKYMALNNLPSEEAVALVKEINERIKVCSSGLFVELSTSKTPAELIVTPQGIKQYFSQAYEVVGQAPSIEGWTVFAGKQALGKGYNFQLGEFTVKPDEVTFMPLGSDEHPDDIAIRLYHKAYVPEEGEQKNALITGLYSILDTMLGEESSTFDFQYIDFDDMPHPKEKDYPLGNLASYVEHKKSTRKVAGERFPKEDIGLLEGKVDDKPTLLVINNGLKYYAFSKDFPFLFRVTLKLQNVGDNGLPKGNTDELYKVEDVIYKFIYKEEKGHFIATETFDASRELFYYTDSLETIEKALADLPKALTTCELSYEVNYDPFWVMVESYIYM